MTLEATRVEEILLDCLFREGEDTNEHVEVRGVVTNFGLHPQRLESHRAEILELLAELPDDFMRSKGGGHSFLNACYDRHGRQWGEHMNMEQLFCLGIGIGAVKEMPIPRELLPGGVPYYGIDLEQGE